MVTGRLSLNFRCSEVRSTPQTEAIWAVLLHRVGDFIHRIKKSMNHLADVKTRARSKMVYNFNQLPPQIRVNYHIWQAHLNLPRRCPNIVMIRLPKPGKGLPKAEDLLRGPAGNNSNNLLGGSRKDTIMMNNYAGLRRPTFGRELRRWNELELVHGELPTSVVQNIATVCGWRVCLCVITSNRVAISDLDCAIQEGAVSSMHN